MAAFTERLLVMSCARIEEFKIDAPGGKIYAKRWVPEIETHNLPVILLHDSLGSVDLWRDFPKQLAESLSRTVVAYDRLGFGKSDERSSLPSIEFIEEEAIKYFPAIKGQLSIGSYVILGHSVGGAMAVNIASRDADCQAVITVSAQAFVESLTVEGIQQAKRSFEQPGQIERLEKWHGEKAKWVLHAWTDVWLSDEFKDWSLEPAIHGVRCPVLAIHGDADEYGSTEFPKFIANNSSGPGEMLIIESCGHMPHKEKPQEVIDALRRFLGGLSVCGV
ncbi:MAG: alpha/beta fold hydrolase [Geoalkalibacter sp.]|uniref:alpha/beta fold hydrolase n=1 Tax=Geoalkalibacter sp. TaxID=3041440 RepID=UPI003D152593